ncbi:SgcJ/EcaC family oxidoreductase [Rhodococcus qingshengii]|uniref:SgcJ/EcaC family oxidoreductase n=1 Tax=Rhodococcus qingshengii TaxID=334542 RepID=A0AAW6LXK0_RHOSG|nr:SgcJ/EcaC family oxidoreductase [Rhodococcus qingshengii]MDE8649680.1 SgcJ/EcaC family oxidoreductase [Rhodococcus qingshengii]
MTGTVSASIARLIDATNAGDVEGFLDAFAPDGVVDDWGREFAGRDEIREWSDAEFLGKQVTLEVRDVAVAGSGTVLVALVGGNGFNGPSTFTFAADADKVLKMSIRA